jgi:hypothetical protein
MFLCKKQRRRRRKTREEYEQLDDKKRTKKKKVAEDRKKQEKVRSDLLQEADETSAWEKIRPWIEEGRQRASDSSKRVHCPSADREGFCRPATLSGSWKPFLQS